MNKILAQKAFAILALTCVILIALFMVSSVVDDREKYRSAAVQSIEASYAGPQVFIGPVLVRPYTQTAETTEVSENGEHPAVLAVIGRQSELGENVADVLFHRAGR